MQQESLGAAPETFNSLPILPINNFAAAPVSAPECSTAVTHVGLENFAPVETRRSGWDLAHDSYAGGMVLELCAVAYNRGGLLIDMGDVRGFVPSSQLHAFPRQVNDEERKSLLEAYIGKPLKLKVIELDRAHNRLILSERVARMHVSRGEQLLYSIQPGQVLNGTIRNVTDFGAFVDLGGVEGLIHVSEMSWQRVGHPRDVCTAGMPVQVYVIDVHREQRRIGLSLKRLHPDPWALAAEHYKAGDTVDAVITNIVSFGAFARLPEGIEGLIHTSELAEGNFLHPNNVVREGDTVRVRIMSVDPSRQRIGLTMRKQDAAPAPVSAALAGPPELDDGYWNSLIGE